MEQWAFKGWRLPLHLPATSTVYPPSLTAPRASPLDVDHPSTKRRHVHHFAYVTASPPRALAPLPASPLRSTRAGRTKRRHATPARLTLRWISPDAVLLLMPWAIASPVLFPLPSSLVVKGSSRALLRPHIPAAVARPLARRRNQEEGRAASVQPLELSRLLG